jgi:hypothetical protein
MPKKTKKEAAKPAADSHSKTSQSKSPASASASASVTSALSASKLTATSAPSASASAVGGTYIRLQLAAASIAALRKWALTHSVPNPTPDSELHITLVNSEQRIVVLTAAEAEAKEKEGKAPSAPAFVLQRWSEDEPLWIYHHTFALEVWSTKQHTRCLVLTMHSAELSARHALARECGATHRWPLWSCHLALSYDLGDAASGKEWEQRVRRRAVKPPECDVGVVAEVVENRVENWSHSLSTASSATASASASAASASASASAASASSSSK